ncbi:MAG: DnaA N-terminal domain-containing protein [Paracoccus sp. (in: a-proteobacteria)]|uniref:DnaA N-terminal domain-containing protein n=1 Tax=Paracoccus sp. TaxID=267 RepID=UPI00391D4B48
MQVIRPVGREAAAKKYDILSALMAHALASGPGPQRLVLRLMALITTRYNWQRDELTMGQREIARLWCVDERTVKRDMAQLRALGWVTVKRQGARGRVSVLGLDLDRIALDTRPAWPNIGEDYVARMTGRSESAPAPNVVPFRKQGAAAAQAGLWGVVCAALQAEDPVVFDAWFAPLVQIEQADGQGGALHLAAPSRFHATYVRTHLMARLQIAARRADPSVVSVRIEAP